MKGNYSKGKSIMLFILMLVVVIGTVTVAIAGADSIRLGLDLQGGVNVVYEAEIDNPSQEEMNAALQLIRTRLDKENYTEAEASIEGSNRIRVDIPGVDDPQEAIESIAATAMLTFEDIEGNEVLTGGNIVQASAQIVDMGRGQEAVVSIKLDDEGTQAFRDATRENIGQPIIIKLDDEVISAPIVNDEIRNGESVIQGNFTPESARQLAERIEAGALPFSLTPISSNGVGAKLGMDAMETSLQAGSIGFALIMIFMIAMYRIKGVAADIALILYVAIVMIILSTIEATLTLPGIAGILLSIGMAVDANVIIFTRIKEELTERKSVRSALDSGFNKAFSAILDGNITTLIAATVLYTFGTGLIKSFAMTLGIGIVVSMFTSLVVTRFILKLFVGMGIRNESLYGAKNMKAKEA